jgi:hypothetical protein
VKAAKWWDGAVKNTGMFLEDMKAAGVPGAKQHLADATKGLISGTKSAVSNIADALEGVTLRKLREAGSFYEAVQHAYSNGAIEPWVNQVIAETFPDLYKVSEQGKAEVAEADSRHQDVKRIADRRRKYKGAPSDNARRTSERIAVLLWMGLSPKQRISYLAWRHQIQNENFFRRSWITLSRSEGRLPMSFSRALTSASAWTWSFSALLLRQNKSTTTLRPIIDIIVKDNILGGHDALLKNIEEQTSAVRCP